MRITVEPIVFLYNIGYTVQLSLQQDFIFSRLCHEFYSAQMCDNWWLEKKVEWVENQAVRRVMWMSVITGLVAVLTSQLIGAALDRFSRKLVMLMPFMGSLSLSLLCLIVAAMPSVSLDLLYIGAAINGVTGGFVVFKASVSTYVVGISRAEEWTDRLSIVESMLFLGSAAGPLGLQLLILYCTTNHALLFLGTEAVLTLAILYIIIILPDHKSTPDKHEQFTEDTSINNNNNNRNCSTISSTTNNCNTDDIHSYNTFDNSYTTTTTNVINSYNTSNNISHCRNPSTVNNSSNNNSPSLPPASSMLQVLYRSLSNAFRATLKKRAFGARLAIVALLIADFFIAIVFAAEFDLLYLYMQNRYGFTLSQYSRYLGFKNVMNGASLLFLLPGLRRVFGFSDVTLGILGGLSRVAAFSLLGITASPTLVYLVPVLDVFGQYLFVVLRSVISTLVEKEEQGRVMTVVSAMAQLSLLLGSLIFDNIYPLFVEHNHPGFTFIIAAVCLGVSTLILGYVHWYLTRMKTQQEYRPLIQPVC